LAGRSRETIYGEGRRSIFSSISATIIPKGSPKQVSAGESPVPFGLRQNRARPRREEQCLPKAVGAPMYTLTRSGIPAAARSPLRGAPRATLREAMALRSWASQPRLRPASRAPYDHSDFNSNALSEDLFSASLEDATACNATVLTRYLHDYL
jgi:hypothetical protein